MGSYGFQLVNKPTTTKELEDIFNEETGNKCTVLDRFWDKYDKDSRFNLGVIYFLVKIDEIITVFVMLCDHRNNDFMYKLMDTSVGPFYYNVPGDWVYRMTEPLNDDDLNWRKKVAPHYSYDINQTTLIFNELDTN